MMIATKWSLGLVSLVFVIRGLLMIYTSDSDLSPSTQPIAAVITLVIGILGIVSLLIRGTKGQIFGYSTWTLGNVILYGLTVHGYVTYEHDLLVIHRGLTYLVISILCAGINIKLIGHYRYQKNSNAIKQSLLEELEVKQ